MTAAPRKLPHPIDRHVGARVRARRVLANVSQVELGVALGVTFQQIQKYEKGANRISASRLHDIGAILGVPASYFFVGAPATGASVVGSVQSELPGELASFLGTPEGARLARAFCLVRSQTTRRRILELIKSLSARTGSEGDL